MSPLSAHIFSMDGHSEKQTPKSGSGSAILCQKYLLVKLNYVMKYLFSFIIINLFDPCRKCKIV